MMPMLVVLVFVNAATYAEPTPLGRNELRQPPTIWTLPHREYPTTTILTLKDPPGLRRLEFLRAHDGDTVAVRIPNVIPDLAERSIRLKGIDAAEINSRNPCEKAMAMRARDVLAEMMRGACKIDLVPEGEDKYGRLLGVLTADGQDVSKALLERKLVVPYDGVGARPATDWCKLQEGGSDGKNG